MMRTSQLILLLLSVIVKSLCDTIQLNSIEQKDLCKPEHDNKNEGICWKLQNSQTRPKFKPGDECNITRIIESVEVSSTTDANQASSTTDPNQASSTTDASGNGKPAETFVVDPCRNEENRNFMECVLNYNTTINEGDPGYNEGKCQCYRNWFMLDTLEPAYNHSMDPKKDSDDWFIYSRGYQECVIKTGERCAPAFQMRVPYRCESGLCSEVGQDPHYKICRYEEKTK